MIKPSKRLERVVRVFDPYQDRRSFVRLDRNEDPVGWDAEHFKAIVQSLTPYDLAAYSDSTEFIAKLSAWMGVQPEQVYVTAGSDAAIKNIFETYVDIGDIVVMQKPGWRMYDVYNDVYQGTPVFLDYGSNLEFDTDKVLELLSGGNVRMLTLANPNQPTGTLIDRQKLYEVIATAQKYDTIVVIDEAYYLFADETAVDWVHQFDNLIVVRTFSKAFGLASLRLGYCVANKQRIKELMLLRPVTDANGLALKIGAYALDNIDWVMERVRDFNAGREYLYERFVESGLTTFHSHTNFMLVRYDSFEQAKEVMVQVRAKNYLLKGPFTFSPLENCVRVTLGPKALMEQFWRDCGSIFIEAATAKVEAKQ